MVFRAKHLMNSIALLALLSAGPLLAQGISSAPPELVSAIAESTSKSAANDPAYAIGANGCARLHSGTAAVLDGCFDENGPRFAAGDDKAGLRLVAWGRGDDPRPVELRRGKAAGNLITYEGRGIREWWRVLPLGYEQGFTLERAPAGKGDVVLEMMASAAPAVESDGNLAWGRLHYGKLVVTDADGKPLPARLTARGRAVRLAFDARSARFPVVVDPLVWLERELSLSDGASNDRFGQSVSLSNDGSIALIGATLRPVGAVAQAGTAYIYTRAADGTWTQTATLTASDASDSDSLGNSVSLSSDGSTALVGAFGKRLTSTNSPGAAYVFVRPASGWVSAAETARLTASDGANNDRLGDPVALSPDGSVAVAGALAKTIGVTANQGAAYVFVRPGGGWTTATETIRLTASDGAEPDTFGRSVAVSTGGGVIVVGADQKAAGTGASYIFTKGAGNTWSQAVKLTGAAANARFGGGAGISADGNTVFVGANWARSVSVYVKPAAGWAAASASSVTLSGGTGFGSFISPSADGTMVLVGAHDFNTAYLFKTDTGWASVSSTNSFTASDRAVNDQFGIGVGLSGDGSVMAVGADGHNGYRGAVYVYPTTTTTNISSTLTAPATVLQDGSSFDVTYAVTNDGTSASPALRVSMPVPAGASYVSSSATAGTCGYAAGTATCDISSIPAGGTVSTTLTLTAAAAGTIASQAWLAASPNLIKNRTTTSLALVSYSGNGNTSGTAPSDTNHYAAGASVTVLGRGTLARTGYTFNGWNTSADGTGTAYVEGGSFNISGSTTLHAQWLPPVHVTYDGNKHSGGTVPVDANNYNAGDVVTVLGAGDMVRDGCTFTGWNTQPGGTGTAYAPGATFTIAADTTLYAQWAVAPGANAAATGAGGGGGAFNLWWLGALLALVARRRFGAPA